ANAILRITPNTAKTEGEILLYPSKNWMDEGPIDLVKLNPMGKDIRNIRGGEISMIFQEPMEAFSPIHTIGNQIIEGILLHVTKDIEEAKKLALEMLEKVSMPNAKQRINEY
ncbi:unnamed protein product, partial [marine sediment metagenome]